MARVDQTKADRQICTSSLRKKATAYTVRDALSELELRDYEMATLLTLFESNWGPMVAAKRYTTICRVSRWNERPTDGGLP